MSRGLLRRQRDPVDLRVRRSVDRVAVRAVEDEREPGRGLRGHEEVDVHVLGVPVGVTRQHGRDVVVRVRERRGERDASLPGRRAARAERDVARAVAVDAVSTVRAVGAGGTLGTDVTLGTLRPRVALRTGRAGRAGRTDVTLRTLRARVALRTGGAGLAL